MVGEGRGGEGRSGRVSDPVCSDSSFVLSLGILVFPLCLSGARVHPGPSYRGNRVHLPAGAATVVPSAVH